MVGKSSDKNPLQWVIGKFQGMLGNVSSFKVMIAILVSVALFKADFLILEQVHDAADGHPRQPGSSAAIF
jgi:hypothetical protein